MGSAIAQKYKSKLRGGHRRRTCRAVVRVGNLLPHIICALGGLI
jgi:hypothetical protein